MNKLTTAVAVLALALLLAAPATFAEENETKMSGSYVWTNGGAGDLEVVFTPDGENRWNVSFYFEFRGQDHVYTGTAEGSLSDGALAGRVTNENQRRNWNFSGTFTDGKFEGTHEEIGRDGKTFDTGTMKLGG